MLHGLVDLLADVTHVQVRVNVGGSGHGVALLHGVAGYVRGQHVGGVGGNYWMDVARGEVWFG